MNWKNTFRKKNINEKGQRLRSINREDEKAKEIMQLLCFSRF